MSDGSYLTMWLVAFVSTLVVETVVYTMMFHALPRKRVIFAAIAVNCLTHPALWGLGGYLFFQPYVVWLVACEVAIVLAEGAMMKRILKVEWREAMVASVAANVLSVAFGYLRRAVL